MGVEAEEQGHRGRPSAAVVRISAGVLWLHRRPLPHFRVDCLQAVTGTFAVGVAPQTNAVEPPMRGTAIWDWKVEWDSHFPGRQKGSGEAAKDGPGV